MAHSLNKHHTTTDEMDSPGPIDSAVTSNQRKKTKTLQASSDKSSTRRSSRANKGSGGQITQMQNIERIQTLSVARVTSMNIATANEPLNPLAPLAPGTEKEPAKQPASKGSAQHRVSPLEPLAHHDARQPKPTWQKSHPGSRFGLRLSPAASSPEPSLDKPASRNAPSVMQPPQQGSVPPLFRNISSAPVLRVGSVVPSSRGSSVVPASRGGSVVPVSQGGSVASVLCGGSGLSQSKPADVPLRNSQIKYRAHSRRPLSRTVSIHDLRHTAHNIVSAPPPYRYCRAEEDGDTELDDDCEEFPFRGLESKRFRETEIDEASPDEDERTTEAALRAPGSPACYEDTDADMHERHEEPQVEEARHSQEGLNPRFDNSLIDPVLLAESEHQPSADDVVRAHHQHNGFPRAPPPERLLAIRDAQHLSARDPVSVVTEDTVGSRTVNSLPSSEGAHTRVAVPDGQLDGPPHKLRSYPFAFREVIERAKLISQCDSATKNPFPPRATFLEKTAEIFNEALAECYWPNYRGPLGRLLWEALMTWRSTIKSKARETLSKYYNVGPHFDAKDNQSNARGLVNQAAFLRDGVDSEGLTNNMAHPGLAALITNFFYSPSSLNSVFPEVFSTEVPEVTVCLVATALRAALDEYTQTGTRQDRQFEFAVYSKVFTGYFDMQCQINESPRHAAKTKRLRVTWATAGSNNPQSGGVVLHHDSSEFRVVLD